MTDEVRFEVPTGPGGGDERLDVWLAAATGWPRREVAALISAGAVTVDHRPVMKSLRLQGGEVILARRSDSRSVTDASAPYRVVLEDDHLAVVAKPAGVVVHPAPGSRTGTLVEALAERMPLAPAGGETRPGIVHRLDKDTSGLLVVAKTDAAWEGLAAAMAGREVARTYLGLVVGTFGLPEGRIEAPVARSSRDRTRMGVRADGREAVTTFLVLEAFAPVPAASSLLEVHLGTGRTHQIRVHLSHIHHPVVGDTVYGRSTLGLARALGLQRPFLHATRLAFTHPITGEPVDVTDPLPEDLAAALAQARSAGGLASE